jgi:hypothetical protein
MAEHDEVCESCERPLKDSRDFKAMKADLAAAVTRGDDLATKLLERTITDAGFDPALGIVKRLAAEYDGELDAEAFKTFAVAEGLTPTPTAPVEQEKPDLSKELDRLQQPGDRLREISTDPNPSPPVSEQIAAAENSGDFAKSRLLKNQQAAALMGAR